MEKKIKISKEAKKNTQRIISYLTNEWSEAVADKFIQRLENKLNYISLFPNSYPSFDKFNNVRKCVLSKQISLYYKIKNEEIEVLTLFDTRQDPDKLSSLL